MGSRDKFWTNQNDWYLDSCDCLRLVLCRVSTNQNAWALRLAKLATWHILNQLERLISWSLCLKLVLWRIWTNQNAWSLEHCDWLKCTCDKFESIKAPEICLTLAMWQVWNNSNAQSINNSGNSAEKSFIGSSPGTARRSCWRTPAWKSNRVRVLANESLVSHFVNKTGHFAVLGALVHSKPELSCHIYPDLVRHILWVTECVQYE